MSPDCIAELIEKAFNNSALPVYGFIPKTSLPYIRKLCDEQTFRNYRLDRAGAMVVTLLPYNPAPEIPPPKSDCGYMKVGAFAANNHYALLIRLLKVITENLAKTFAIPKKSFGLAVNSRLPEKKLAVLAGLGQIGKSDLLISKAYGPACLIGSIILPAQLEISKKSTEQYYDICKNCNLCIEACPANAISEDGINLNKCLQFWASKDGELPAELEPVWKNLLYGCDECVKGCPFSKLVQKKQNGLSPADKTSALLDEQERLPGRWIAASWLLAAKEEEIKAALRKTALGFSWISVKAFKRSVELFDRKAKNG